LFLEFARICLRTGRSAWIAVVLLAVCALLFPSLSAASPAQQQQPAAQAPAARQLGTIKSIDGTTIHLTADSGAEIEVHTQDSTRIVRVEPGQKDLKGAVPLQFKDLHVGDRILVRGQPSTDAKSFAATGIIAMKHEDLEAKRQRESADWQKRGIGGLVASVDPAAHTVSISVGVPPATTTVSIHASSDTLIRRYAPDSVKFDDAKASTLDQIKPGDQLRARGTRSPDGTEFAAEEIVTGAFRNIAGTITAIDAAANQITVTDLIAKKPVVVLVSSESQVHKLPPEMAQRMAARLKGMGGAPGGAGPGGASAANTSAPNPSAPNAPTGAQGGAPGGTGAAGGPPGGRRAPDLQQILSRMPQASISDFQKGDAVMIVSTEGNASNQVTAITLLGGVEPLLAAAPSRAQAMMLAPWSLGGGDAGGGGEGGP
jgi:hypothetical protein